MKNAKFSGWLMVAGSAVITAAAFPPMDIGFAAWAGLIPFVVVLIKEKAPRKALNYGFAWGCIFYILTLHWFYNVVGPAGFLLLAILALFPAITAMVVSATGSRFGTTAAAWSFPFVWTGLEFFRSELWFLKFSWMGLGYSQHDFTGFIQIADVGGVYAVTFIVAAVNAAAGLFAFSIAGRRHKHSSTTLCAPLISFVLTIVLLLVSLVYSSFCLKRDFAHAGSIRMMGVQSDAGSARLISETLEGLTKYGERTDIVVWPEYSLPLMIDEIPTVTRKISKLTKDKRIYLLFGGKERVSGRSGENDFYNTAFLMSPEGSIVSRAVKMNPIQFFNDGLPGREPVVMKTRPARLGIGICYDMDYTYVSRELSRKGAEILVFPTMDEISWGRIQHEQHAAMSVFRAIENRRFLFRVASSGISQMVDAHGRIVKYLGTGETGPIFATGEKSRVKTIYSRYGDVGGWLSLAVSAVITILAITTAVMNRK